MRRTFLICWIFLLGYCIMPRMGFAYEIKGIIHLDDSWQRVIYLSAIRSFDDINAVSEDFIINVASIASDGSFIISGDHLPDIDGLYRLHVCKLGDPPATLFIGGQEENYTHFVMNNRSQLSFYNEYLLFDGGIIKGNHANALLSEWNATMIEFRSPAQVNTKANWEYRQEQLNRYLYYFADTCSNGLVAMLALHQINIQEDYPQSERFYKNFLDKWKKEYDTSIYYQELLQQIKFAGYREVSLVPFIIIGIVLIILLLIGARISFRRNTKEPKEVNIKQLSIQEQKVLDLLVLGKANKEISNEMNIEVSTVKSHVSSIYNKLGVKSRKEIYNKKGNSN
ncbi:MAG: LuxR C-terminal-related transcriptional regulator [Saprospiraceae bacterium]|nr:LuxR C-terminal-related transcriptional regulator [Saprospiraceae bacterium]